MIISRGRSYIVRRFMMTRGAARAAMKATLAGPSVVATLTGFRTAATTSYPGVAHPKCRSLHAPPRCAITMMTLATGLGVDIRHEIAPVLGLDHDALIDQWFVVRVATRQVVALQVMGTIWSDRKGRFDDGRMICTSVVTAAPNGITPNALISTFNSTYLLGTPIDLQPVVLH